jgi:hypothetical protein
MSDEADIQRVLETIADKFGALDIPGWLANFHNPCMLGTMCVDPGNSAARFAPLVEAMRARGLTRSQLDTCHIQVLTDTSAIASGTFTRYAGDSVLERLGATYVLRKIDDRWSVLLVTSHSPDVSVVQP